MMKEQHPAAAGALGKVSILNVNNSDSGVPRWGALSGTLGRSFRREVNKDIDCAREMDGMKEREKERKKCRTQEGYEAL